MSQILQIYLSGKSGQFVPCKILDMQAKKSCSWILQIVFKNFLQIVSVSVFLLFSYQYFQYFAGYDGANSGK